MDQHVVVGGLGGSGTRIVAQILIDSGYYIGSDLNLSLDNLWFTMLLKRPAWHKKMLAAGQSDAILDAIDLFYSAMNGESIGPAGQRLIDSIIEDSDLQRATEQVTSDEQVDGDWYQHRRQSMLQAHQIERSHYAGWGWKEPNTHIFIPYLYRHDESLKYIHVIRHGLDMAFSPNQNQLRNWGYLVGVLMPKDGGQRAAASLDFWIKMNHRSISLARQLFRDNFLLVHFDWLCHDPVNQTRRILDFLNADASAEALSQSIVVPGSSGRFRQHDLGVFGEERLNEVRKYGFDL